MLSNLTAVILTYNEELHIGRCIERLRTIAGRIVVVDSYSTDRTLDIAKALGAEIYQNAFTFHAAQFQWGLAAAGIESGWILRVDADEYLEPALLEELRETLPTLPEMVSAIEFRRKVFFRGKWIRWGGFYPTHLTRLWRAGTAHVEQRWMDEHVLVERGETIRMRRGDIVDDNLKDITEWTSKHNSYSTRQMIEFIALEQPRLMPRDSSGQLNSAANSKRFLRNRVYAGSPLYLRAVLYFLQRYLLRLGFLDGRSGFVFHTLQGYWNFILIDAKIDEARRYIARYGLDAFRDHLAWRHGIHLAPLAGDVTVPSS